VQEKGPGGHILTGPVAILEAEPDDVLEVQILKVDIDASFACNAFGVDSGFLPMEYPYGLVWPRAETPTTTSRWAFQKT
jgi:acetamidase/formamidase